MYKRQENESALAEVPLDRGPMADFLEKINRIQGLEDSKSVDDPQAVSYTHLRIPPRGLYRASPCKAWHKHRKKLLKHCFINERDMREDQWRTFLFVQVCPSGDSTRAHSVTRLVPHSQLGGP